MTDEMIDLALAMLAHVETQEEFDALVHNLKMLWATKGVAAAQLVGAPVSSAKN